MCRTGNTWFHSCPQKQCPIYQVYTLRTRNFFSFRCLRTAACRVCTRSQGLCGNRSAKGHLRRSDGSFRQKVIPLQEQQLSHENFMRDRAIHPKIISLLALKKVFNFLSAAGFYCFACELHFSAAVCLAKFKTRSCLVQNLKNLIACHIFSSSLRVSFSILLPAGKDDTGRLFTQHVCAH